MRRRLLLVSLVALVLAGCGGSDKGGSGGGGGSSTPAGASTDGKALFAGTCGSCHTLEAAGTSGTFGPNLDDLKPDKQRVLHAIETGPGPMPDHLFKGAQADAIATYVSGEAGK